MKGRAVLFVVIFCVLQLGWQALGGTWVQRLIVDDVTVGTACALVNAITPEAHARAVGTAVHAPGGGLNIINGCDGTETWFLLCAAFAVVPLTTRGRIIGLILGTWVVFSVNELRVLALFYANRSDPDLFNLLHAVVGPIAVILAVAGFFYGWVMTHAPRAAAPR
jgi:exosortase/archaeosortase family protein